MKTIESYGAFERISSLMIREFGTIKRGHEEEHAPTLLIIERNLLKMSHKTKNPNGRRAMEAVKIALFTINGYLNGWEYDFGKYLTPENKNFAHAILMAIDPFTNDTLREALGDEYDWNSTEVVRQFFTLPVKCILRIESSMQTWTDRKGANGYFAFLQEHLSITRGDYQMDYVAKIINPEKFGFIE